MKLKVVIIMCLLCIFNAVQIFAQGKHAGRYKSLIGKSFTDEKHIAGLQGYTFMQGDMITDVNDAQPQFIDVYVKGNSAILIYTIHADGPQTKFIIADIIYNAGTAAGWEFKTTDCMEGETEGQIIIALVKAGTKKYVAAIKKAWRCNRDKHQLEAIAVKNIKCLNEGAENE